MPSSAPLPDYKAGREAMIDEVFKDVRSRMEKAVQVLQSDLMTLRTGRASPALLEKVKVDYYGTQLPLNQIASIRSGAQAPGD